jgi:hypothetical protein
VIPRLEVTDNRLLQLLDGVAPGVQDKLRERLAAIGAEVAADANMRTAAHIRSWGAKDPGTLATSFRGGLAKAKSESRVTGYARSSHPLAHLMEYGFTIKDMMITASAATVMAFAGDAGEVFRRVIHRHATKVPAYPALRPAFDDRRGEVIAAFAEAAKSATP